MNCVASVPRPTEVPAPPRSCPRCLRASNRLGADWCCWELVLLAELMGRDVPPTMRDLVGVHFIGRSEKSIDNTCRRYGLKTPSRSARRRRCNTCLQFDGCICVRG